MKRFETTGMTLFKIIFTLMFLGIAVVIFCFGLYQAYVVGDYLKAVFYLVLFLCMSPRGSSK